MIRREFLGWERPALAEAAARLAARYRKGHVLDLGRVIVVVPGQRAGRRLQELLAFLAEDEKLLLTPPQVVTEGKLPEMLYTPKLPFANDVVQDLAWAQALRDLPEPERRHVVPHPPDVADALRWLELGKVLRRVHVELAADGLDFTAVNRIGPKLADFSEQQRWQALTRVQVRYHELLDQEKLWDIQTARLKAIEFREIRADCDIILLGTVDLTNTLRQMLEMVAERVTAYIVAPEGIADRFDTHGCLVPAKWCEALIPLSDEHLCQVEGPLEQADAVSEWLVNLNGRFRSDEVVIGVPDESLVAQLQRQLVQSGVRARWVEGVRLGETAPYRLLAAAVAFAGRRRYQDLAALLRHPDLEDWLGSGAIGAVSLPAQLDSFYNTHLPSHVRSGRALENAKYWPDLAPAVNRIEAWLGEASASHPLRVWGDVFRKILGSVYGNRTLHLDDPADEVLHRTIRKILDECDQLGSVPEALDALPMPATDAFRVALGELADEHLPPPADADAVEILGWLELPLDDAKAVIITSFNEGFVPKSTGADAFLPDRLRKELGVLHNDRRYARDAYATSVLCHAHQELRVLLARRDAQDEPRQPSRLVFACPDEALIARAQRFFAERKPVAARRLPGGASPALPRSRFEVPRPVPSAKKLERISVTRFRDYLACPYRYYLRHVKKLEVVDDSARELGGDMFGSLLHGVLGIWGRDPGGPRHSDREKVIVAYLNDLLSSFTRERYGQDRLRPAIRLQLEQARRRLPWFASHQAQAVREGWRIAYAENDEEDRLSGLFPGLEPPITLVGRIDRIDFHERNRTIRILDYKTGDNAETPDKKHRNKEGWIDLQLPLYRHLWRELKLEIPGVSKVELGYFNIPKARDDTSIKVAVWNDALLEEADEIARRVIRNIRAEDFRKADQPPKYSEDFAAICLENTRAPTLAEDGDGDQL
jgi:ATP-dependent helicase/nuclease subunit B